LNLKNLKSIAIRMRKEILIIIPARYASRRMPGKPLIKVAGKEILRRSWEIAKIVEKTQPNVEVLIATDDFRIKNFCEQNNMEVMMTSESCKSGTERSKDAVAKLIDKPNFIINLEADNLCPPWFIESLVSCYNQNHDLEVISPCLNLTWSGVG